MTKRGILSNFFLWVAGVDKNVIKCCPQSEYMKHESFGVMLFIPMTFSFFAMYYAASTFENNKLHSLMIAAVWSLIIFIIDRTLVTTYRKSDTIVKDIFSVTFFFRVALALALGAIIAHPMTMYIFQGEILKKLDSEKTAYGRNIKQRYNPLIKALDKEILVLESQFNSITFAIDQSNKVLRNELTGVKTRDTSGKKGYGDLSRIAEEAYKEKIKQKEQIQEQLKDKKNEKTRILDEEKSEEEKYIDRREYSNLASKFSEIKSKNKELQIGFYFIFILFVFIDTLAITLKTFTKKGIYDRYINELDESSSHKDCHKFNQQIHKNISDILKDKAIEIIKNWKNSQEPIYILVRELEEKLGIKIDSSSTGAISINRISMANIGLNKSRRKFVKNLIFGAIIGLVTGYMYFKGFKTEEWVLPLTIGPIILGIMNEKWAADLQ